MEQDKNTLQVMTYPDYIFLLSAYAHIRVLMEDAGVGISGGIVLYIPNSNAVESVIHDIKQCGGMIGKIRGSQLPSSLNYKAVLVRCQGNHNLEIVFEFLACTEYLPLYLVSGILPDWLRDYANIILADEELDTDSGMRLESLNDFMNFSHSHANFIIEFLNSLNKIEKYKNVFVQPKLYQAFYCIGLLYNHYLHVVGKALQLPINYFDELDNTLRDAIEFDDFDLEVMSAVYKALLRYLDAETDILIGNINEIRGELFKAVKYEKAILYDSKYYYIPDELFCQAMEDEMAGLFHEGFQTTSFIMNLLSVGSESGHPAAFTAFFLFSCPHLKKCAKHPLYLIYTFFQILYTYFISIKTLNSAEDIFLSQKKVIAEIIHGFCHDLRTVTIQYGYPQDVIGKLPDQRQIVL